MVLHIFPHALGVGFVRRIMGPWVWPPARGVKIQESRSSTMGDVPCSFLQPSSTFLRLLIYGHGTPEYHLKNTTY